MTAATTEIIEPPAAHPPVPVPRPAKRKAATQAAKPPVRSEEPAARLTDEERFRRFGEAVDKIRRRVEEQIGKDDVDYITKVDNFSRAMTITGRALLHFSVGPVSWTAGVIALWIGRQLQATEIGHTALHGAFDGLPGAEKFQSETFDWDVPIDEESWRYGHNIRHHQFTNIAGKDPDIHFGPVRLNAQTPHRTVNYFQLPIALAVASNFGFAMNPHFTGLLDVYSSNGRGGMDTLKDRSWKTIALAHWKTFRKWGPYYLRNYAFFPALAGPGFLKVLAGNMAAEILRDLYTAATIWCGHVGEDVKDYPEGTKARNRGEWYAMQVEGANNFEVPLPLSMLCGALDRQIEHHLFPKFPTNRLREVAPEIRQICEEYGISYKTGTWPNTLGKVFRRVWQLSFPDKPERVEAEAVRA